MLNRAETYKSKVLDTLQKGPATYRGEMDKLVFTNQQQEKTPLSLTTRKSDEPPINSLRKSMPAEKYASYRAGGVSDEASEVTISTSQVDLRNAPNFGAPGPRYEIQQKKIIQGSDDFYSQVKELSAANSQL